MRNAQRFADLDASIAATDRYLEIIERQHQVIAEKLAVLGRYVDVTIDVLQEHESDDHGGQPN